MPSISFERVSLVRGDVVALNDVSLTVADAELITVVGPSGSGKSSLLRLVAGLEWPTSGRLLIGGVDMQHVESVDRDTAMVFQDHALYPHKTTKGNLAFPLEVRHVEEPERSTRVEQSARAMSLMRLLDRRPRTLSVGQRHATATARALIRNPAILLLDEPLSNLDAKARLRTRVEIQRRHQQSGATSIYATNDQSEAMALGDRVVVLNRGMVQQFAQPLDLYESPVNLFVARFIGSPPMNVMTGLLEPAYPDYVWVAGADRLTIPTQVIERHARLHEFMGRQIVIGIRSEHLQPALAEPFSSCLHGVCRQLEDHGGRLFAHVDLGFATVVARTVGSDRVPGIGNPTELSVDFRRLHFFDPQSGAAL